MKWQCHSLGAQSLVSHCRGLGSIPGHSMWDMWWTKRHWDRLFFQCFGFSPLQYSSINTPHSDLSPTLYDQQMTASLKNKQYLYSKCCNCVVRWCKSKSWPGGQLANKSPTPTPMSLPQIGHKVNHYYFLTHPSEFIIHNNNNNNNNEYCRIP